MEERDREAGGGDQRTRMCQSVHLHTVHQDSGVKMKQLFCYEF
jgi:hypothetical protein